MKTMIDQIHLQFDFQKEIAEAHALCFRRSANSIGPSDRWGFPSNLIDPRLPHVEVLVVLHQPELDAQVERVRRVGRPAQQSEQLPP